MTSTILIIDDSSDFRKILELRLRSFVPEPVIFTCGSLAEARELLSSGQPPLAPDLVILDLHLPDGPGIELLKDEQLQSLSVLTVSSDDSPEIPGLSVGAGATYFLSKAKVSEPLLRPLVLGLLDRNRIRRELDTLKQRATVLETVRTLVDTLRHEINNPLGAVLGAAYILKTGQAPSEDLQEAARLVEESGQRIKHVLEELGRAVAIEPVMKANHRVFHIPGDKPWDD
jgi:CheY-like chemotaxis protein